MRKKKHKYILSHKYLISKNFCNDVHTVYQKLNETKSYLDFAVQAGRVLMEHPVCSILFKKNIFKQKKMWAPISLSVCIRSAPWHQKKVIFHFILDVICHLVSKQNLF